MPIPSAQDIIKLIKAGATIEAQEKIMELRQAMMDLQEQNIALRSEVQSLKAQLADVSGPSFPLCPKCGQRTYAVQESKKHARSGVLGHMRTCACNSCGFTETTWNTP